MASGDNLGSLIGEISWGRFDYEYNNEPFILYIASVNSTSKFQFLVHEPKKQSNLESENSKELVKNLILRASYWGQELHNEVWVYDHGFWQKDAALWDGMQKASWDDVILPPDLKCAVRGDVASFFQNKSTYDDIGIAWKRGIILYGPPGNGKTLSIKATMKDVYYSLAMSPIPTLYVRSLQAWDGDQSALLEIFEKARSIAPCMLVLEDLDSLINPGNRSYFLNQMDGLDDNDGILVVGTTNHLDELDPGIVSRPSRFDRKYEFSLPGAGEGGRPTYVEYWRKKLENRPGIQFPESLVAKIVDTTEHFSFAYMKEAFVSTLLLIAARQEHGNPKDRGDLFEKVILQQLKILRKQIGNV
ncbi:P-loop containing nucleoside triphosphate hydrolase protein [Terfezia claveryi]|nr:P-loop containing nucleoside triphosphate hydrolase protein [Terfezia claveryi]